MNLGFLLEEASRKFPHKCAAISGKRKITYKDLNKLANQLTSFLIKKKDLKKGSRVAILHENSIDYLICLFAAVKAAMISVPLNIFFKPDEINYVLNDCEVELLITSSNFSSLLKKIEKKSDTVKDVIITDKKIEGYLFFNYILDNKCHHNLNYVADESEVALISYTSSTTGWPKGVMLSHKNITSNVISCFKAIKVRHNDCFLLILPMFHSFTLTTCIFLPVMCGSRVVIFQSVKVIQKILKEIIFNRISIIIGIPQMFRVLKDINPPKIFSLLLFLSPLRLAVSGADALDKEVALEFMRKYRIKLLEGYGLTEAGPVVSINPINGLNKIDSVGLPLPDIEVKIVDMEENELAPNEVGELIVKGSNIMKGYYNMPEDTSGVIKGEWLFTGDLAKIDEDGYIYIYDRKKDVIISHGMNIYPREVEGVIGLYHKVKEVAVIGRKDKFKGEIPIAVIVPKEGEDIKTKEIIDYCRERLANYKIPHLIEVKENLPKTPTGKILKRILKKEYQLPPDEIRDRATDSPN